MRSLARMLSVVVCLALLTVSSARPGFGHRRHRHNHGHHPRRTQTPSRVVFDGIAATSFVESHEPEEPSSTTYYPTQTTTTTTGSTGSSGSTVSTGTQVTTTTVTPKTTTIVPDTCDMVGCQTHGDCTYNGCGGYFCVTCPTCDGQEEWGVCLWNPSPEDMNCPVLNCPTDFNHRNTIDTIDTPPSTFNFTQLNATSSPQNETQIEQPAEPPQEQQPVYATRPASPWDSSFSNLKEESQNNTEAVYEDQSEGLYNGTESSGHDLG